MVLRVRDVERVAVERETLWAKESGLIERAVGRAARARADRVEGRAVKFSKDDAIVVRVGDEEACGVRISEHLAGEGERQVGRLCALKREPQRLLVQLPAFAKLRDGVADQFVNRFILPFALD